MLAKTDATEVKIPHVSSWATTLETSANYPTLEFRGSL